MHRNKIYIISAIATLIAFSGCDSGEPDDPMVEGYVQSFIKKYGLIDPKQDWNLAERGSVKIVPATEGVGEVRVFAYVCGNYYLAASQTSLYEAATLHFDAPEGAQLFVAVDGEMQELVNGETINCRASSRAGAFHPAPSDFSNLGWIIAAEDLGATDDFDFNDVVIRLEYDDSSSSEEPSDPEIIPGFSTDDYGWEPDESDVIMMKLPGRGSSGDHDKDIKITAMAAGGTLPVWLHYIDGLGTDYIVSPNIPEGYKAAADIASDAEANELEWHQWFSSAGTPISQSTMINTGQTSMSGRTVTLPHTLTGDFTFTNYSSSYTTNNGAEHPVQGFYLTVRSYQSSKATNISAANPGSAPHMFLIPDIGWYDSTNNTEKGWLWAKERVNISDAYSLFGSWINSAQEHANWYTEEIGNNRLVVSRHY